MATLQSTTIASTGTLMLPRGTTAERPATPTVGMMRYNTTLGYVEVYIGTTAGWLPYATSQANENNATIVTSSGSHVQGTNNGKRIHTFLSGSHTFTPSRTGVVEVLVVFSFL